MDQMPEFAPIPFFGVARAQSSLRSVMQADVMAVLDSGQSLAGEQVEHLETRVAAMAHRQFGIAVGSATDGLYFSLVAMGIRPGDEVLVTALSFVASASCIMRCGAVPVFVDVDHSGQMDFDAAGSLVTSRTTAVLAVHLYGNMIDPNKIIRFAKRHVLAILEDASQSLGSRHGVTPAGNLGAASVFSFDPTKVIGAPGSSGMVVTDDKEVATRVKALRCHGKVGNEFQELGYNSQMPTLAAAVIIRKLDFHDGWTIRRREIAQRFDEVIKKTSARVHSVDAGVFHIYHKYTFLSQDRDAIAENLKAQGIPTRRHYSGILPDEPVFSSIQTYKRSGTFPIAQKISKTTLSLPMHAFLTDEEVTRIEHSLSSRLG